MIIVCFLVYILLCFVVAALGSDRKFGFWGYFFCSLALSPISGVIVLLGSSKRAKQLKNIPNV
jgi:hypothetical protein